MDSFVKDTSILYYSSTLTGADDDGGGLVVHGDGPVVGGDGYPAPQPEHAPVFHPFCPLDRHLKIKPLQHFYVFSL